MDKIHTMDRVYIELVRYYVERFGEDLVALSRELQRIPIMQEDADRLNGIIDDGNKNLKELNKNIALTFEEVVRVGKEVERFVEHNLELVREIKDEMKKGGVKID